MDNYEIIACGIKLFTGISYKTFFENNINKA
jgi:hypothetical protein